MKVIEEIARYLDQQSVGSIGSTLFYGILPDVEESFSILVRDTGGMVPDKDITDIKNPTFQIFVRSETYGIGKGKLDTIRSLLHGVMTEYLRGGGIYYRRIHALAEGGHLGKNDSGYHEFSINFEAEIVE